MKKAEIWISAVLYMALGVILLSVILAVGVPAVNKARDKAAITQTKEVFVKLDQNIRAVYNEGPGSQRPVQIEIGRGQFSIDNTNEEISWELETQSLLSQPGIPIQEGNLIVLTQETSIKENYLVILKLNYLSTLDINYLGSGTFTGSRNFLIQNTGLNTSIPVITITEI
ncbi:MAG: hypothetical protein AABY07_09035 [Nanoarchaeota archaeon]